MIGGKDDDLVVGRTVAGATGTFFEHCGHAGSPELSA